MNQQTNRKIMTSLVVVLLCIGMISGGYATWLATFSTPSTTRSGSVAELNVSEYAADMVVSIPLQDSTYAAYLLTDGKAHGGDWMKVTDPASKGDTPNLQFDLQIIVKPNGKTWASWTKDTTVGFKIWFENFKAMDTSNNEVSYEYKVNNQNRVESLIKSPTTGTGTYIEIAYVGSAWTASVKGNATTTWENVKFENGVLTLSMTPSWGDPFGGQNPNAYINSKEIYTKADRAADSAKLNQLAKITQYSLVVKSQMIPAART